MKIKIKGLSKTTRRITMMILAVAFMSNSGCKDDSSDPKPDDTVTKTLKKELLLDKRWYNQSGGGHYFLSNGDYDVAGGYWEWVNDSDTMIISMYDGDNPKKWVFEWSTEHEMSCKLAGNEKFSLYKDEPWQ